MTDFFTFYLSYNQFFINEPTLNYRFPDDLGLGAVWIPRREMMKKI